MFFTKPISFWKKFVNYKFLLSGLVNSDIILLDKCWLGTLPCLIIGGLIKRVGSHHKFLKVGEWGVTIEWPSGQAIILFVKWVDRN